MTKAKGGARPGAGRKPYQPTADDRKKVETMAGIGLPQDQIALVMGTHAETLRKHFRLELDTGAAKANAMVGQSLFQAATTGPISGPRVTAGIFWAKTRMGWKETSKHEMSGPDGGPIRTAQSPVPTDLTGLSDDELAKLYGEAVSASPGPSDEPEGASD